MNIKLKDRPRSREDYPLWWAANTREPFGYCWCGCGEKTPPYTRTNWRANVFKGEPRRYADNHEKRVRWDNYIEIDLGYYSECWMHWNAGKSGYVSVNDETGKGTKLHRLVYKRSRGPIPNGWHVHHACEVKSCVNPDHLVAAPPGLHHTDHMVRSAAHKASKTSKYKGVRRQQKCRRWQARLMVEGHNYNLGFFDTEEEAARAYDKKVMELRGDRKVYLNFPQEEVK